MSSHGSSRFWRLYSQLPPEIQKLADKNYRLWVADHWHPSLHFKKVRDYWVARVGDNYRAVGIEAGGTVTWFWIGPHDEYKRLIAG
ncbi:MAG: hypothetical protein KJ070_25175 [Verrucomicrobia bacterium]|nr:hypothetical protein [Verrucomicrobiota bacterium]